MDKKWAKPSHLQGPGRFSREGHFFTFFMIFHTFSRSRQTTRPLKSSWPRNAIKLLRTPTRSKRCEGSWIKLKNKSERCDEHKIENMFTSFFYNIVQGWGLELGSVGVVGVWVWVGMQGQVWRCCCRFTRWQRRDSSFMLGSMMVNLVWGEWGW